MLYYKSTTLFACGKRGIRTLGTRKGTTVFETVPKDRAKARAVANLANSAGCKLTGPNTNHERDPFISGAKNMVAISKSMIIP